MRTTRYLLPLILFAIVSLNAHSQSLDSLRARQWVLQSIEHVGSAKFLPSKIRAPWVRFGSGPDAFDSTRLELDASGGCDPMSGTSYAMTGPGRIDIRGQHFHMNYCDLDVADFAKWYEHLLSTLTRFDVGDGWLRLWNVDSTRIMHFGIYHPTEYGTRIQIANAVPGATQFDLFLGDTSIPFMTSDTFGRASDAFWLHSDTRRFAMAVHDSGYSQRFLDTVIAPNQSFKWLVAYLDTGGLSRVHVLTTGTIADTGTWRFLHLATGIGRAAMRVSYRGGETMFEERDISLGEISNRVHVRASNGTNVALWRYRDGRTFRMRGAGTRDLLFNPVAGQTLVVSGDADAGTLMNWNLSDVPILATNYYLSRGDTLSKRATRIVNLAAGTVSTRMQSIPSQVVAPYCASSIDDDLDRNDATYIVDELGDSTMVRAEHAVGTLATVVRVPVDGSTQAWSFNAPFDPIIAADSALLRVANTGRDSRYRIEIVPTGQQMIVGNPGSQQISLRATIARVTFVKIGGARDSAIAYTDVSLPGGCGRTVLFSRDAGTLRAWLLVDCDHNAQRPMVELRTVALPPPSGEPPLPDTARGRLSIVNLTSSDARVMANNSLLVIAKQSARSTLLDTGTYANELYVANGASRFTVADSYRIADDSVTMMAIVGDEPLERYRALTIGSAISRRPGDTMTAIRIVNALNDIDAVDLVDERRIFRDEWTDYRASMSDAANIGIHHKSGERLFTVHGAYNSSHRNTVFLTGSVRAPHAFVLDDDVTRLDTLRVTMSGVSGIATHASRMRIAPNPATESISIAFASDEPVTMLQLIDAQGQIVMSRSVVGSTTMLPVAEVPSGVYTVVAKNAGVVAWVERVAVVR